MPLIKTPEGGVREVDALNAGDIPADGSTPITDRILNAGPNQSGTSIIAQIQNPGALEDSLTPSMPSPVAPIFRNTNRPRNTPGLPRARNTTRPGW